MLGTPALPLGRNRRYNYPMSELPYMTAELPGIGGRIREHLEDFQVEEIPLYPFSGKGTHAYFRVTKTGVPTPVAVQRIARHMGVGTGNVGFAGMKDSQAVTSQWMSIEFAAADQLARFRDKQVSVSDVTSHGNKLRLGHLAGNRFRIRIRGVGEAQLAAARAILDVLQRRGAPNFFGEQRFGRRGDTGTLGAALVRGDINEFVKLLLGRAMPGDPPEIKAARDAFDAGYFDRALHLWPRTYTDQRRALIAYKRKQDPRGAVAAVDRRMKRLYVSAFQSEIFNEILRRRLATFDRALTGDLAQKIDSGGIFPVEDEAVERPRAERFEISPTAPIPGYRCKFATGEPGRIEQEVLGEFGMRMDEFDHVGSLRIKGTRRALRFRLADAHLSAGNDGRSEFLELAFVAPSGCYATVVLREIMKGQTPAGAAALAPAEAVEEEAAEDDD
jgi:tRNA pseudouridine13 synthase